VKRFSAAVIGLGQIGQGYDYDLSDDRMVLTHASAYHYHKCFNLVAAVDHDPKQCERFVNKYGSPAYPSIEALLSCHDPEVFSICVPTSQHFKTFMDVIFHGPLAILCEKPIAAEPSEGEEMVKLAEAQRCILLVNYIRRFDPGVLELKEMIQRQECGEIYKGVAWYSKGIIHNGSHYIDLLRFLLGEVTSVRVLERGRKWMGDDPEPDIRIYFGDVPIYFLAAREECYSAGSIELVGTRGQILCDNSRDYIEVRRVDFDSEFSGYKVLSDNVQRVPSGLKRYQEHVLDHLHKHLAGEITLSGDGKSALKTLKVVHKIVGECS
jgi:predicted dehydrogenase